MTDPREVVAEALAAHRASVLAGLTAVGDVADAVLDALTAAGYAVVEVAERRDEHTVDHAGRAVRRMIYAGPWQPDPAGPA